MNKRKRIRRVERQIETLYELHLNMMTVMANHLKRELASLGITPEDVQKIKDSMPDERADHD